MPGAIIQQSQFTGNGTQAGFLSALNASMVTAGFTNIATFTKSGHSYRTWEYQHNDKIYGKSILEVGFTTAVRITMIGYASFDTGTNTGEQTSITSPWENIDLNTSWNFYSIEHPQMRGVFLFQDLQSIGFIGYYRPSTLPSSAPPDYIDEDLQPYGFIPRTLNTNWNSLTLQPISRLSGELGNASAVGNTLNAKSNSGNSGLRILRLAHMEDTSNNTHVETFSEDIRCGASFAMVMFDTVNTPDGNYAFIDGSANATTSRLFIKVQ